MGGWVVGWLRGWVVGLQSVFLRCRIHFSALQNFVFLHCRIPFSALQNFVFCAFRLIHSRACQILHCRISVFCIADFSFSALQKFCFPCTTQSRRWQHIVLRFLDGWMLPGQLVVRWPSFAPTCNPPKMPAEIKAPNPPLAHPPSVLRRTLTQFIYNVQTTHFT